ncbi:MAG: hypothetical protein LUG16_07545 [Candidatus Gastranaerophilales bacterium]|nr:hypothetical protein [Candidatus Gastranaerophilales bacterium]
MQISNVSPVSNNVSYKGVETPVNTKSTNPSVENGDEKLKLALSGLAAAGAATAGVALALKSGNKAAVKETVEKAPEAIESAVEKVSKPAADVIAKGTTMVNGKLANVTQARVTLNTSEGVKELAGTIVRDAETGKTLNVINNAAKKVTEPVVRTTKEVIKNGNKFVDTMKNGKLAARKFEQVTSNGTKKIFVNNYNGENVTGRIISIAKDGTKNIIETAGSCMPRIA